MSFFFPLLQVFQRRYELYSRIFWTILLAAAGAVHLALPHIFEAYYPPYLPHPHLAVLVSGMVEWTILALLWIPRMKLWAWLSTGSLMIAYLPVHIYVLTDHTALFGQSPPPPFSIPLWVAWLRLPVQILFIIWAFHLASVLRR